MPAERTQEEVERVERVILQAEEALANTRRFLKSLSGSDTPAHKQIGSFAEDLERRIAQLRSES
ncbi:MAG TPA: hypothetical protein VFZ49_09920 [Pyrinomonadaceae bacterium]